MSDAFKIIIVCFLCVFVIYTAGFLKGMEAAHENEKQQSEPFVMSCTATTTRNIVGVYVLETNKSFYCDGAIQFMEFQEPLPQGFIING